MQTVTRIQNQPPTPNFYHHTEMVGKYDIFPVQDYKTLRRDIQKNNIDSHKKE